MFPIITKEWVGTTWCKSVFINVSLEFAPVIDADYDILSKRPLL